MKPTLTDLMNDIDAWLDYQEPTELYTPRQLIAISDAESGADREGDYDYEEAELKAYHKWLACIKAST